MPGEKDSAALAAAVLNEMAGAVVLPEIAADTAAFIAYLDETDRLVFRSVPASSLYQITVYAIDDDGKPIRIEPRPGSSVMVAPVNCRIVTRAEWLAAGGRETSPLDASIL